MYSDCMVCSCCFFSVTGFDTPLLSIWCSLKFHGRKPKNLLAFWKRKSTPSMDSMVSSCFIHVRCIFPGFNQVSAIEYNDIYLIDWFRLSFVSIRLLPPFLPGPNVHWVCRGNPLTFRPRFRHWASNSRRADRRRGVDLVIQRMQLIMANYYSYTPKFNIASEKWWLEDYFPIGKVTFQGLC